MVQLLSCLFPSDERYEIFYLLIPRDNLLFSILRTVMMLARGPWPSEPVTYPLLTQLPWFYLSHNGILLAIGSFITFIHSP